MDTTDLLMKFARIGVARLAPALAGVAVMR